MSIANITKVDAYKVKHASITKNFRVNSNLFIFDDSVSVNTECFFKMFDVVEQQPFWGVAFVDSDNNDCLLNIMSIASKFEYVCIRHFLVKAETTYSKYYLMIIWGNRRIFKKLIHCLMGTIAPMKVVYKSVSEVLKKFLKRIRKNCFISNFSKISIPNFTNKFTEFPCRKTFRGEDILFRVRVLNYSLL